MKFALFQWTVNNYCCCARPIRAARYCIQLGYYQGVSNGAKRIAF